MRAPMTLLSASLLALALTLPACQTPTSSVRATSSPALSTVDMSDVAVAAPTADPAMSGEIRGELYDGLLARNFSPLDPEYVDGGGRGDAMLLTTVARGPEMTGARTALYDATGQKLYEASVAVPNGEADAAELARLLLRDLPSLQSASSAPMAR